MYMEYCDKADSLTEKVREVSNFYTNSEYTQQYTAYAVVFKAT